MPGISRHILPVIVIAHFFCTSLWFAGNAILPDLALHLQISQQASGSITSAVQFGFIARTLAYASFSHRPAAGLRGMLPKNRKEAMAN